MDTFADTIELLHIRNGKDVRGINAFDANGDFILSEHYEDKLEGAIVNLRFSLSMTATWEADEVTETFYADIESMRVIIPA